MSQAFGKPFNEYVLFVLLVIKNHGSVDDNKGWVIDF